MPTFQIKAEGHRDLVAVIEAKSVREALDKYGNEIKREGDRKMIKTKPDRLLITTERGERRCYEASKV